MRARGALLWAAAALISAFTMRRYLEPFDEGLLMQAASRILDGQWPYADFGWPYGPGQPVAVAGLSWLFEPSVAWWRAIRVAADATAALAVWALVRPVAGDRWALAAWLAAAVTVAQPTSANPFPVALAFALCAVLAGRARAAGAGGAAGRARRRSGGPTSAPWPRLAAVAALLVRREAETARERVRPALVAELDGAAGGGGAVRAVRGRGGPGAAVGRARRDRGRRRRRSGGCRSRSPTTGRCAAGRRDALAEDLKDVLGFYLPLAGS